MFRSSTSFEGLARSALVLRGRRNDLGIENQTMVIDGVAMIEQVRAAPPWSAKPTFRRPGPPYGGRSWLSAAGRKCGPPPRAIARPSRPRGRRCSGRDWAPVPEDRLRGQPKRLGKQVAFRVPGQRVDQDRRRAPMREWRALSAPRASTNQVVEFGASMSRPGLRRDYSSFVEGVLTGVSQGDELEGLLEVGKGKGRGDAPCRASHRGPTSVVPAKSASSRVRRSVKLPTFTLIGWISRPPDHGHDLDCPTFLSGGLARISADGPWPCGSRRRSRGSRGRAAGRRAGRGSRSTRRSRGAGAARASDRATTPERLSIACTGLIW